MYPVHCKRAVPFGIALRIKRNCSTDDFLQNRCKEYKAYLKSQNYPAELVDKQFDKALSIPRAELLRRKVKPAKKKKIPLVLDYNPILRDIQKVIKKHFYLLQPSPEVKEIFPSKSIFSAYRRTKILKEMLAPSKFRLTSSRNQREENRGCSKCDMKYFILILLHYHFWYLFIPEFKGSFQGFCYVFHQFFIKKRGPWRGGYCYGLMALSWDPVVIFTWLHSFRGLQWGACYSGENTTN